MAGSTTSRRGMPGGGQVPSERRRYRYAKIRDPKRATSEHKKKITPRNPLPKRVLRRGRPRPCAATVVDTLLIPSSSYRLADPAEALAAQQALVEGGQRHVTDRHAEVGRR